MKRLRFILLYSKRNSMFLIRLIRRLAVLIFSNPYKRYLAQMKNAAWPYDDKRFTDHAVRSVYAGFKIRKQECNKLWIIHAKNNLSPYLFFHSIHPIQKVMTHNTAASFIMKTPLVEGKCFLKLMIYKYPSRCKMRNGMKDEILFSTIRIETLGRIYNDFKLDFYI